MSINYYNSSDKTDKKNVFLPQIFKKDKASNFLRITFIDNFLWNKIRLLPDVGAF